MHGIHRERNWPKGAGEGTVGVARVRVRYSDGRVLTFVPDANAAVYSGDDVKQLAKVVHAASSKREWSEVYERGGM